MLRIDFAQRLVVSHRHSRASLAAHKLSAIAVLTPSPLTWKVLYVGRRNLNTESATKGSAKTTKLPRASRPKATRVVCWRPLPPLSSPDEFELHPRFQTLCRPDQTPEHLRYLLRGKVGRTWTGPEHKEVTKTSAYVILGYHRSNREHSAAHFVPAPSHWIPYSFYPCQLVWESSTQSVVLHELGIGILHGTRRQLKDFRDTRSAELICRALVREGHLLRQG